MAHDPRRPVRIGVQIKPQHADYAQIRAQHPSLRHAEARG